MLIGTIGKFYIHIIADARDSPGYYGTTYMAAKAATIAPWYFVRGLPRSSDESSKTITPTKLGAVFDLINYHTRQDEINKVSLADRKKFVIHCDSREIEPAFIYVCIVKLLLV